MLGLPTTQGNALNFCSFSKVPDHYFNVIVPYRVQNNDIFQEFFMSLKKKLVVVELSTSPCIKAEKGNPVSRTSSQNPAKPLGTAPAPTAKYP